MKKINTQKGASDIGLIIIVIIGLFLIWLIFGGAEKANNENLLIDNPLNNIQTEY